MFLRVTPQGMAGRCTERTFTSQRGARSSVDRSTVAHRKANSRHAVGILVVFLLQVRMATQIFPEIPRGHPAGQLGRTRGSTWRQARTRGITHMVPLRWRLGGLEACGCGQGHDFDVSESAPGTALNRTKQIASVGSRGVGCGVATQESPPLSCVAAALICVRTEFHLIVCLKVVAQYSGDN